MTEAEEHLASDIIRGADQLALYLFGDVGQRRKVYHLASTSNLPVFKLGSMICARKSKLLKYIEEQEGRHTGATRKQA